MSIGCCAARLELSSRNPRHTSRELMALSSFSVFACPGRSNAILGTVVLSSSGVSQPCGSHLCRTYLVVGRPAITVVADFPADYRKAVGAREVLQSPLQIVNRVGGVRISRIRDRWKSLLDSFSISCVFGPVVLLWKGLDATFPADYADHLICLLSQVRRSAGVELKPLVYELIERGANFNVRGALYHGKEVYYPSHFQTCIDNSCKYSNLALFSRLCDASCLIHYIILVQGRRSLQAHLSCTPF